MLSKNETRMYNMKCNNTVYSLDHPETRYGLPSYNVYALTLETYVSGVVNGKRYMVFPKLTQLMKLLQYLALTQ